MREGFMKEVAFELELNGGRTHLSHSLKRKHLVVKLLYQSVTVGQGNFSFIVGYI
jgi:hypothetical protein